MDELFTYIKKNQTQYEFVLLWIGTWDIFKNVAFKIGSAVQINALNILENLTKYRKIKYICTDSNPVCSSVMRYYTP